LRNTHGKETLFITGGLGRNHSSLHSTESFNGTAWNNQSENLPEPFRKHCLVKINSTTVLSIGGYYRSRGFFNSHDSTYFYNAQINKWTPGPPLIKPRSGSSCAILEWKNPKHNKFEKVVVVAGGDKNSTVELLDLNDDDTNKNDWIFGPSVPYSDKESTMIGYNNSVILIGGYDGQHLYQLSSPDEPWILMKQMLKIRRKWHVSFLVPDEIVNCRKSPPPLKGKKIILLRPISHTIFLHTILQYCDKKIKIYCNKIFFSKYRSYISKYFQTAL